MQASSNPVLSTRRIVITAVLAAIAILLGATRLGFIPVPNVSGNATIMHVPAIIGGVLEGPWVGLLVGGIFGVYSMLQDTTGLFRNPLVSIVPRLFIGVVAYFVYISLRKNNEWLALVMAGVIGTLTNTVLVVAALIGLSLIPPAVVVTLIPQAIAEIIIAAIITVAVVVAWKRIDTGKGGSSV
ncbi:MAG: ECF transporter S component [Chloroflexi bacterium]|nr:ECF transporter S component [Chloroflexota bacterium]